MNSLCNKTDSKGNWLDFNCLVRIGNLIWPAIDNSNSNSSPQRHSNWSGAYSFNYIYIYMDEKTLHLALASSPHFFQTWVEGFDTKWSGASHIMRITQFALNKNKPRHSIAIPLGIILSLKVQFLTN